MDTAKMTYTTHPWIILLSVILFSNWGLGLSPSDVQVTKQIIHGGHSSNAIVICKVAELPFTPHFEMSKIPEKGGHGELIHTDYTKYVLSESNSGAALVILSLTKDDAGLYRCSVCNLDQQFCVHNQVTVNYEETPSIIRDETWRNDFEFDQGEEFKFYCNTSGVPEPKVWWEKYRHEEIKIEGPLLHFKSISQQDAGTYYCVADNGIGTPARMSIKIRNVYFPPEITPENTTVISERGWNVFAVMRLDIKSLPKASVKWWKETQVGIVPIEEDGVKYQIFHYYKPYADYFEDWYMYYKASLAVMVTEASDAGKYKAIVENRLGAAVIEFTLTVV